VSEREHGSTASPCSRRYAARYISAMLRIFGAAASVQRPARNHRLEEWLTVLAIQRRIE